jgi:hypothetical protein
MFSKLIKFMAKAAIPDADDAIPELCGNVFSSINCKNDSL